MAAPRATHFIALRNLARGSQQARHLHMTGPATYASPILVKERPVVNLPRDVAGLRAECKRRNINASGSKSDLLSRLNADALAGSRAYSTAAEKRPSTQQTGSTAPVTRNFNTSRTLKASSDSSTIDFCYFPMISMPSAAESFIRVPILPNLSTVSYAKAAVEAPVEVMKPEIHAMSADAVYLPMSDSESQALGVDIHAMAETVAANIRRLAVPTEERASMMKQIWNDMVDDLVMGGKKKAA